MGRGTSTIDWSELEQRVRSDLARGNVDAAAAQALEKLDGPMLSYMCTMLDDADAQDALSRFRVSLWQALPRFRWECPLRPWAYQIAQSEVVKVLRRPHRRREVPLPSSAASHLAPSARPSGSGGRHAHLELLRALLPVDDQALLTLRVDRELEWEEIAVVLAKERRGDRRDEQGMGSTCAPGAVALRKRYERLTRRLEKLARESGLLD